MMAGDVTQQQSTSIVQGPCVPHPTLHIYVHIVHMNIHMYIEREARHCGEERGKGTLSISVITSTSEQNPNKQEAG